MENEEFNPTLWNLYRIANTLFWINLVPALVACCVSSFFLLVSLNHPEGLTWPLFLILGIYCEWLYHKQRTNQEYLIKKFGWIYSIIINIIWITFYVASLFAPDVRIMAILGIYPLCFLIASCFGLVLINKLKRNTSLAHDNPNIIN
jgi:hypothetical protein